MLYFAYMNESYFKTTAAGLNVVALGLIVTAFVGGFFYLRGKQYDNTLSVTGSAKMEVTSDTATWSFTVVRKIKFEDQSAGYAQIADDVAKTKDFLVKAGISADAITANPPSLSVDYDKQQVAGTEPDYQLSVQVSVTSSDVNLITSVAQNVSKLVDNGIYVSGTSLSYYYSKLPDLRASLSGEAVKDAKVRAEAIASASGGHVGTLQSVSGGVIQVLSPDNSTDVSDYGTYDTSTIKKEVTISVHASFTIQ